MLSKNELRIDHRPKCKIQSYKTLGRHVGENTDDFKLSNEIQKAQTSKERNDELDFFKIKHFCSVKDTVKRMRRLGTDSEKIFAKHLSFKGQVTKYI